jgi:hypothetical protein
VAPSLPCLRCTSAFRYYAVSYLPIRRRVCRILHATIESLYRPLAPSGSKPQVRDVNSTPLPGLNTIEDIPAVLMPWLHELGVFISSDVLLMTKLLRVLKQCLQVEGATDLHTAVETIMRECMLPSLSLVESGNPSLMEDVWGVISTFPYQVRYRM